LKSSALESLWSKTMIDWHCVSSRHCGCAVVLIWMCTSACTAELPGVPNASGCDRYGSETTFGPEDLVFDDSMPGGRLIVSSQKRPHKGEHSESRKRGQLYWMNLVSREIAPFIIEGGPPDLYPHGIDLVRQDNGTLVLYVVNHGDGESCHSEGDPIGNSIETYIVEGSRLKYREGVSFTSSLLTNPNDVTATPSGDFYVTNTTTRCYSNKIGLLLESIPGLRTGSVLEYRRATDTWTPVLRGLFLPNGIALSRDGSLLWLAESGNDVVTLFQRPSPGVLHPIRSFSIPTPDNLTLDGDGMLVASHLSKWRFWRHSRSTDALSPWAIYELNSDRDYSRPIIQNDGSLLSGASAAVHADHKIWIGQVYGRDLLSCPESIPR
jgi:hypothetical protein